LRIGMEGDAPLSSPEARGHALEEGHPGQTWLGGAEVVEARPEGVVERDEDLRGRLLVKDAVVRGLVAGSVEVEPTGCVAGDALPASHIEPIVVVDLVVNDEV